MATSYDYKNSTTLALTTFQQTKAEKVALDDMPHDLGLNRSATARLAIELLRVITAARNTGIASASDLGAAIDLLIQEYTDPTRAATSPQGVSFVLQSLRAER